MGNGFIRSGGTVERAELVNRVFTTIMLVAGNRNIKLPVLTEQTELDGRLGLDSLDWATIIVKLEMEFAVEPLSTGKMVQWKTLGDVVETYQCLLNV